MLGLITMDWFVSYVDDNFIITIQYHSFLEFDLKIPKYDINLKKFTIPCPTTLNSIFVL